MVTININIGNDGKSISTTSSTLKHSQEDLPSPISQNSLEGANSGIPSPLNTNNSMDSVISSSVPHPIGLESSISVDIDQVPTPSFGTAQNSPKSSNIPGPMDSEEHGSASPTTKQKTSTTKRKSRSK